MPIPLYPELRMGLPAAGWLRRRWRADRPDVVHVSTEGPLGHAALSAAEDLGIPLTSSFHTNFHEYSRHYGLGWLEGVGRHFLRKFHNRTVRTLVPSETVRSRLAAQGFENLALLGRGVDTRLFDPARRDPAVRASWGVPADGIALLCVGRVAKEKNLELAFQTLEEVRRDRQDVRLVLVGDGPLRRAWAARPGLVLPGMLRGERLAAQYASADLFLFPSLTETFGNVLCEAMASGLPTVAFDYAAAGVHVEHGVNGWKVPYGDAAAFRTAAVGAVRDAPRRIRAGALARLRMEQVGWDAVVATFEEVLGEVAGRSPSHGIHARLT
jgi:glycosyltransferase involved in cell wall biosynthesis